MCRLSRWPPGGPKPRRRRARSLRFLFRFAPEVIPMLVRATPPAVRTLHGLAVENRRRRAVTAETRRKFAAAVLADEPEILSFGHRGTRRGKHAACPLPGTRYERRTRGAHAEHAGAG